MNVLPERPLKLKRSFILGSVLGGGAALVAGIAAGAAYLIWQGYEAKAILEDGERWEHATPVEGGAEGSESSHMFVLNTYDLRVRYLDPNGSAREAKVEFTTFIGGPDTEREIEVRYDPEHPDHPLLSWAIETIPGRWRAVAFMSAAGVLIGWAFVFLGWMGLARWRSARAVAARSVEVACPIADHKVENVKGQDMATFFYELPDIPELPPGRKKKKHKAVFTLKQGGPILVGGNALLVLVSPDLPQLPFAVREDFHPFELDELQRDAAVQRLSSLDGSR